MSLENDPFAESTESKRQDVVSAKLKLGQSCCHPVDSGKRQNGQHRTPVFCYSSAETKVVPTPGASKPFAPKLKGLHRRSLVTAEIE
jgi:hypothetical protein